MVYYLHKDDQQTGPYTLEELKQQDIAPNTKVWREDMDYWVEASELVELKDTIRRVPPPITQTRPRVSATVAAAPEQSYTAPASSDQLKSYQAWYNGSVAFLVIGIIFVFIVFSQDQGMDFANGLKEWDRHMMFVKISLITVLVALIFTTILYFSLRAEKRRLAQDGKR